MTQQEILERITNLFTDSPIDKHALSGLLHSLSERIEALEGKKSCCCLSYEKGWSKCLCECHIGAGGGNVEPMIGNTYSTVNAEPVVYPVPTLPEDWEKEFGAKFGTGHMDYIALNPDGTYKSELMMYLPVNKLKSFIKSTIEKEREKWQKELEDIANSSCKLEPF